MSWSFFLLLAAIFIFSVALVIPFGIIMTHSGIARNRNKYNKEMLDYQIQKKREELEIDRKKQQVQQREENPLNNMNGGTSKKQ